MFHRKRVENVGFVSKLQEIRFVTLMTNHSVEELTKRGQNLTGLVQNGVSSAFDTIEAAFEAVNILVKDLTNSLNTIISDLADPDKDFPRTLDFAKTLKTSIESLYFQQT